MKLRRHRPTSQHHGVARRRPGSGRLVLAAAVVATAGSSLVAVPAAQAVGNVASGGRSAVQANNQTANVLRSAADAAAEAPVAKIYRADTSPVKVGTPVHVDGSVSTGTDLTYTWSLNGSPEVLSTDPVLNYAFDKPSMYDVRLVVTDKRGRSDTVTFDILVQAETPVAKIASPEFLTTRIGTEVTLDGSASTGTGLTYSWRLVNDSEVLGTDPVLHYTFNKPGYYGIELVVANSAPTVGRASVDVEVEPAAGRPVANISPEWPTTVKVNTQLTLDGSRSTGDDLTYAWRLKGQPDVLGTQAALDYTFDQIGESEVELTVTDSWGLSDTASVAVFAEPPVFPPIAHFTQTPPAKAVTPNSELTFDGTSPDREQLTYAWYINDKPEVVSTDPVLKYTFTQLGSNEVKLVVTDPWGQSDTKTATVTVSTTVDPPYADFIQTPPWAILPQGIEVTYDASDSTGDHITYEWLINDELVSTDPGFKRKFTALGNYDVTLRVTDATGRTDSTTGGFELVVLDPPAARLAQTPPSTIFAGATIKFDGSASTGDLLGYNWTVNGAEAGDYGYLEYTFKEAGKYDVDLQITDLYGRTSNVTATVEVIEALTPQVTASPPSPVAAGTQVTFTATESGSADNALTYSWYVRGENGVVGTGKVFRYTFKRPGSYGVELRVTDTTGREVRNWTGFEVTPPGQPPVAIFTQTPAQTTVATGTEVTFDGSASTGDGLTYAWYVRGEKGVVSTNKILNHTFKAAGKYGVELRVTNSANQTAKKWTELTITGTAAPPVAVFTQTPAQTTVATGTEVTFDGSASTGDGLTYAWYVRGEKGVVSTNKILNHTFKTAGKYGVELRVIDPTGATAKKWVGLTVTE